MMKTWRLMMKDHGGSQESLEAMSLLYSSSFKYPDIELRKNPDFMESNHFQNNSFLTRYRSAPSSFFENLTNGGAAGYDGYQYDRASGPEIDNFVAKYMLASNGSSGLQGYGDDKCVKREEKEPVAVTQFGGYSNGSRILYQNLSGENSTSVGNSNLGNSFCPVSMGLESSIQRETGRSGSGLARQNSSPADLFSKISGETGSTLMRDVSGFRACNGVNNEANPSTSPLYSRMNLTSGASPRSRPNLPRIAELENEIIGVSGPDDGNLSYVNDSKRHFMSNLAGDSSWPNSPVGGRKRARETDGNLFPGLNRLPAQNVDTRDRASTLTHHLSLPKSFAEMATMEKLMEFQGSIPCKIRAKRGCATHPRSIAERVRRTRISERMKKLQDLFPHLDKQTNTADMLEMAVEYIKDLQKQVKALSDAKAKCTCSSIHKQYSNLSA